jgi:8-amino-7-oxononanoate synthase
MRTVPPSPGSRQGVLALGRVASARRHVAVIEDLFALGSSPHGSLFDRQNLGAADGRIVIGPPGRAEFNAVEQPRREVINLATYGYLGLGSDARVKRAASEAIERYGTHTGGPRLLSGTAAVHCELEARLAGFLGADSVVTFSSGYGTNVSVIPALFGPGDVILLDRNAHRSLYDGAVLSRATVKRFAHNDMDHLERLLERTTSATRRLVVVDAVYSMEGHLAPIPALVGLVRRHGAFLLADEAHSIGVVGRTGRGVVEHYGLNADDVDIRIGTLSKAIPAVGGFAAAHGSVGVLLRYTAHARVFSAAMTPADAAAALAGVDILEREPERVTRLQENAALFRSLLRQRGLDTFGSETAVVPVRVGDRLATLDAAHAILDRGVYVNPILSPGVPAGSERLRCFVTAAHARADLRYAAATIADVVGARERRTNSASVG